MSFRDLEAQRRQSGTGSVSGRRSPVGISLSPVDSTGDRHAKLAESIKSTIFAISANISSIQRMTQNLGTDKDTHSMRDKLQNLTHATQSLIKQTTADLKRLHELPVTTTGSGDGDMDERARLRKLEQQKISRDFQSLLGRFQQVQRLSAEKCREYVVRAKEQSAKLDSSAMEGGINRNRYMGEDEEGDDVGAPLLQIQQQQKQQTIVKLDREIEYNETIIAEREQSIAEIEHAILEVNEIFRDLGSLVQDQQGMVDNIEANIESTATRTGDATIELQTAEKYQKKARNRMFCLLLTLIIVISVVLIVLLK